MMVSATGENAAIIDMYAPNAKAQAMVQNNVDNKAVDMLFVVSLC